jgi:hypothetical protein
MSFPNTKRCADDWWRPCEFEQSELCLLGDVNASSRALSLLVESLPTPSTTGKNPQFADLAYRRSFNPTYYMLFAGLCSVMLRVSTAHLRCDPQSCISPDAGEVVPTVPRNAKVIAALRRLSPSVPARSISDWPSSSRSSESPYYTRPPAGSGSWGPLPWFMRVAHPSVWFQKSNKSTRPPDTNHLDYPTNKGDPRTSLTTSFRSLVPSSTSYHPHRSTLTLNNTHTHTQGTLSAHPFSIMTHAPLPTVSSHDSSEDEEDCPVCLEPLSFSFRLPGEKPHIVPECGHAGAFFTFHRPA